MKKTSKTNYSWRTSLPAWLENPQEKQKQAKLILWVMRRKRGKSTIKEVQDYLHRAYSIRLPQSTVSGRMNDLIYLGHVAFFGETKVYKDRLRKVFEVRTTANRHRKPAPKRRKIVYRASMPAHYQRIKKTHYITFKNGTQYASHDNKTWTRIEKRSKKAVKTKKRRTAKTVHKKS